MARKPSPVFDSQTFCALIGLGQTILKAKKDQIIFSQGEASDAVFYILEGKVKLTVISLKGREAVIGVLKRGAFFGEACLTSQLVRMTTAAAISRVRFFLNKFRTLGFIEYKDGFHVHNSLLNIVLQD